MAQNDTGLRRLLTRPWIYDLFQNLVGGVAIRRRFVRDYLGPFPGARILDIGCGTGNMLPFLPGDCGYLGFDFSEDYIAAARARIERCLADRALAPRLGRAAREKVLGHYRPEHFAASLLEALARITGGK